MTGKERVEKKEGRITRRDFIKYASATAGVTAASIALAKSVSQALPTSTPTINTEFLHDHAYGVSVPSQREGAISPMEFLTSFYRGESKTDSQGQAYKEFNLTAASTAISVARGVQFPAWVFVGPFGATVPGPTLRATQGDRLVINLHNADAHPHTIHLHGIHPALADGVFEDIGPGERYPYDFVAEPFGLFLYHCHVMPVKKHIAKGLYGAFIVDPPASYGTRPNANEMVMVMNGFDVDFDDENEFYTVNGIANYFLDNPIQIEVGKLVRIYLVNMTEFDPVNSFHLHGNMFRLYRTGTRFDGDPAVTAVPPTDPNWLYADKYAEITDTVFLGQGERAILEFVPKHTGRFLFHAHQSEFIELGWTGLFNVV